MGPLCARRVVVHSTKCKGSRDQVTGDRGQSIYRRPFVACSRYLVVLLCLAMVYSGCETTEQVGSPVDTQPTAGDIDAAERARRMAGLGIGLELRRWHMHVDTRSSAARLSQWAANTVLGEEQHEQFRRNGLRLFRVPMDELDALEDALRPIGHRQRGWHGQILGWEPVVTRMLEPGRRAVAIDGRVRRFDQREFHLMLRSWIMPMEDGRRMLLAFVPMHDEPDEGVYRRLLGREHERAGRSISSLHVELLVKPDEAIVLAREEPGVEWGPAATERWSSETSTVNSRRNDDDDEPFGPGAIAPLTLGELLLSSPFDETGGELLIFIPHVPKQ